MNEFPWTKVGDNLIICNGCGASTMTGDPMNIIHFYTCDALRTKSKAPVFADPSYPLPATDKVAEDGHFEVYALGLVAMSVCAHESMRRDEIEHLANVCNPTGIKSSWRISSSKVFKGGEPMPCQCSQYSNCKHWLLEC